VGIEGASRYLDGGIAAWKQASLELAEVPQIPVQTLTEWLQEGEVNLLDVRREPEWQAGHIQGATLLPLDHLDASHFDVAPDTRIAVHCKSGYRSMIACSLLQRAGFKNIVNVIGGFDAWVSTQLPVVVDQPVTK